MTSDPFQELKEALLFLRMQELKDTCNQLHLPYTGTKLVLIERIIHFLKTGQITTEPPIPEASKAKKGAAYPLHPQTKILFGNYKNDGKTRAFLKELIGSHFHFTAYGIDWIKKRWMEANPPSYQEFATFWQTQHEAKKLTPKEEWAYINFAQKYLEKIPHASHKEVIQAWKEEQQKQVEKAKRIIDAFSSRLISDKDLSKK